MPIYQLDGQAPELPDAYWIAETAVVIGRVRLKSEASIWFGTVLRADDDIIEEEAESTRTLIPGVTSGVEPSGPRVMPPPGAVCPAMVRLP